MAATCVNGHATPRGQACMYCGAPIAAPPPPAAPAWNPAYAAPAAGPGRYPPGEPRGFSALAIVSLVTSLLFPFGSVPAIVLGWVALRRIQARRQDGRGLALAGVIIGSIGVFLMLAAVVIIFVSNGIVEKSDSAPACRTEARTVATATEAYFAQYGAYPTSVDQLVEVNFLRRKPELFTIEQRDGAIVIEHLPGTCESVAAIRVN